MIIYDGQVADNYMYQIQIRQPLLYPTAHQASPYPFTMKPQ